MIRFLALMMVWISVPVSAAPLIADLSNYQITMDSTFNGTRLFVFGTRNDSGDVVVAVRGPQKNYVVWNKQQVGGIWVNSKRQKLFGMPDYYALASSKPLAEMQRDQTLAQLALGHAALFSVPTNEFTQAFIEYQQRRGLYQKEPTPIHFMGETLFKTVIEFPDNIPPGTYTAEIYLLADNRIVGSHVLPIDVRKVGIDAFVFDYAHQHPLLYGITAVVLALCAGWFAGRLFER